MLKKERGLGRGLDALFSSSSNLVFDTEEISQVKIDLIVANQGQPRRNFSPESLEELAKSIKEQGILQPILVRPQGDKYEIIAGERRFRAAKLINLELLPVVIKEIDDDQVFEIALIENLQREDLTILEEALAYKNMMDQFGYIQETIAEKVGKSRSHIANTLRILNLPPDILIMLDNKKITAGHARTLLAIKDPVEQLQMAQQMVENKVSVREAERRVQTKTGRRDLKPVEIIDIEERLQKHLGTKAEVASKRKGGTIQITYYDQEDLQRIIELLGIIE